MSNKMKSNWSLKNIETGELIHLTKPINKAGRNNGVEIVCRSSTVSRNHGEFVILADGSLRVQDFQSSNGTFLNNKKIDVQTLVELKNGDEVGLGICRSGDYKKVVQPPYYIFQVVCTGTAVENTQDLIEILDDSDDETSKESLTLETSKTQKNLSKEAPTLEISKTLECSKKELPDHLFIKPKSPLNAGNESNISIKSESIDTSYVKMESKDQYSLEDASIVLSDDDDEEFLCSQLFKNDDAVSGPVPTENIFTTIKEELSEMDKLELTPNPIPIDNEELDWEENMDADKLQSILDCDISSISYHEFDFDLNDNASKKMPELGASTSKETPKYIKPPIIEPHLERSSGKENGEKNQKSTTKRKSEKGHESPSKKRKRSSGSRSDVLRNLAATPKRSERLNNKDRQKIKDLRSEKLKEIAKKSEEKKENKTQSHRKVVAKVSSGRGSFLLDESPTTTSKRKEKSRSIEKPTISKKSKDVEKSETLGKSKSAKECNGVNKPKNEEGVKCLEKSKSEEKSKCVKIPKIGDKPESIEKSKQAAGTIANVDPRRNKPENNEPPSNYTTNSSKRPISRTITKSFANLPIPQVNNFDIILNVLKWPTSWLEEQRHCKEAPSVSGRPPVPMKDAFESYEDYYDTVYPLLTLELWYSIFKDYDNCSQKNYKEQSQSAIIESVAENHESSISLSCMYYIEKETATSIREEDLLLIQVPVLEPKQVRISHCKLFGFVCHRQRIHLSRNDKLDANAAKMLNGKPAFKIQLNIKIKKLESNVCVGKYCYIRYITNLTPPLRIFKSAKYLKYSQLCKYVLKPSIEDFVIRDVRRRKLISKDSLNDIQQKAVFEAAEICTRDDPGIYMIQGPPGTGKSTVIANIVQEILFGSGFNNNISILLAAPSNAAIDELAMKLIRIVKPGLSDVNKKNFRIVRVGPPHVIHPEVLPYSLNGAVVRNIIIDFNKKPEYADAVRQMDECKVSIRENKRLGKCTRELESRLQKMTLDMESSIKRRVGSMYHSIYKRKEAIVLSGANIICTTLSSCIRLNIEDLYRSSPHKRTCCIIDEATQSTEQETLIPLVLGINKLVLVGDPQQLPATTLSMAARKLGYGNSLFARIQMHLEKEKKNPITTLYTQYRMHPEISSYPNSAFYKNKLRNCSNFKVKVGLDKLVPYLVLNMSAINLHNANYSNEIEVDCVAKLISGIQNIVKNSCTYSIGVITPYNVQKDEIRRRLSKEKIGSNVTINVNTVDSFQGQEKDIIIISCVRFDSNSFLADDRRLNVAITRAKYGLYIIGSNNLFKTCVCIGKLSDNAESRQLLYNINSSFPADTFTHLVSKKEM